jgi:predicted PurR-regulated permease PerM
MGNGETSMPPGIGSVTQNQKNLSRHDQLSASFIEIAIRLAVLALLIYLSLLLVQPFITIFIWSAVLTVALYPAFEWTSLRLGGRRRLAAALITIISLLIVIGPATWLALGLVDSIRMMAERFDVSILAIPPPPASVKDWPLIGAPIFQFWDLASTNFQAALAKTIPHLQPLGSSALRFGADTGLGVIKFFASIIIAGFLFSPAPVLADVIKRFSRRLSSARGEEFASQAGATIRAVSRGVIGVSALQALLAGIGLMVAGFPQASLITFAVLVFAIVQIGPSIILIPAIVWGWTWMDTTSALLFTMYMLPVNFLDNLLRPIVMGRGLKTPVLVILVGVIGGTLAFGITGLFLGPIILAVIWELFVAWIGEPPQESSANKVG